MFEISMPKQSLLPPLLTVAGAVDKKQAISILSNILLELSPNGLQLTATDLEIQMTCTIPCQTMEGAGVVTVPTKKMIDIVRSLEDAILTMRFDDKHIAIKQDRSQFKLSSRNADEINILEFSLPKHVLVHLLQMTAFAMSQQDVRVYLNGLLLEIDPEYISAVAMDGHRMAVCRHRLHVSTEHTRILLPKKSIQEILRLSHTVADETLAIAIGKNHFAITTAQYRFSTKLIEARFPPYNRALPQQQDKQIIIDKDILRRALQRIMILAHEKFKAVQLDIRPSLLTLIANNQDQEEAIETI